MRSRNTHRIFIPLIALLIFILSSVGAFAQGKHGDKHGGDRENHGNRGENRGNGGENRGGWKHQERNDGWQGRGNGNGNGRWQREQRVYQQPQRIEQRQYQQPSYDRGQRQVWREERQQQRRIYEDRGRWQQQMERRQNYGDARGQRRNDDYRQNRESQRWNPWNNYGGFRNYGQYRSDEVHRRNAERKAWKNDEKAIRYYDQAYPRYSYRSWNRQPYYEDNGYVYQYPRRARANILRSLISNVLGSNNYSSNYYTLAQPVYYGDPFYPAAYTTRYNRAYPQYYQSYAATPYYYVYQPSGYSYYSQNNDPYYVDNYFDNVAFANYPDAIGGGFVQQVFSNLLAVGYEQGYFQGLNARRSGYGTRNYYDPYDYAGTNYLSSYSLGENRSCLSDGYELGYNDALYNRGSQDLYQDTNVDLVSLLIGNALQVL